MESNVLKVDTTERAARLGRIAAILIELARRHAAERDEDGKPSEEAKSEGE
jgi:hypothetical protein